MAKTKAKTKAKKAAPKKSAAKPAKKSAPVKKSASKPQAKKAAPKAAAKKAAPKKAAAKAPVKKTAPQTKPAKKTAAPAAKATAVKPAQKSKKALTENLVGLFTPLDDRVLILRSVAMDRTPGGLYIPESASERPNEGQVVAVGRGHRDKKGRLRPLDVQMDDMVMFGGFSGSEVKIGDQEVFVVREKDIIAVVGN